MRDHPNFTEIEVERVAIFARLRVVQSQNVAEVGHYVQYLISPGGQSDGAAKRAFEWDRRPTDSDKSWPGLAEAMGGVRARYYVHRHDGPGRKQHYTLGAEVFYRGRVWRYEEVAGVEFDWAIAE